MNEISRKNSIGSRYLSFILDNEEYCIDIRQVREIKALPDITPVPQTPEYIRGVINLRGKIIPIVDLRMRFNFPHKDYNARTSVIIVEYEFEKEITLIGLIVDVTNEVLYLDKDKISSIPYINEKISEDFIDGMTNIDDRVIIKLNIQNILNITDMRVFGNLHDEEN